MIKHAVNLYLSIDISSCMNVAALFSGGKDSTYALYIAQQWGWTITHLITLIPHQTDSWMYHSLNINLTDLLSKSIGIPLITKEASGEKESELKELYEVLNSISPDGVISGVVASEYQRTRVEQICHDLGIKSFTPLWHKSPEALLRDEIQAGFQICIVGVFAQGFDKTWLGRIVNESMVSQLKQLQHKYSVNIVGEGGEFESLVLHGPIFNNKLVLDETVIHWKRDHGFLEVVKAHLESNSKEI